MVLLQVEKYLNSKQFFIPFAEKKMSSGDGKIHKMEIIQAITHLPEVKPHVVEPVEKVPPLQNTHFWVK